LPPSIHPDNRAGQSQLYLHLNDGGPFEVLPDFPNSLFLLGFGGLEFSCRFARDAANNVVALTMEGSALTTAAQRIE
jgi:hypothetical protein